ncbi:MAG: hypothetical protein IJ925_09265, partial [Muribaculaceae bacterium]|nr:hypothetical protein [Muribaculaceae bacterium]
ESTLVTIVVVEIVCAVFIFLGLFTRLTLIPSIGIMIYAEVAMMSASSASTAGQMFIFEPGYPSCY